MKSKSILLLPLVAIIAVLGCNRTPKGEFGDFETFYNRFMKDSLYQMDHIMFPLEGMPDNADSSAIANGFHWDEDNWVIHHKFDPAESGFHSEFIPLGDGVIQEKIIHRSGEYGMLRRFAKLSDEWYLIYYAGLNPLRKEDVQIQSGFSQ